MGSGEILLPRFVLLTTPSGKRKRQQLALLEVRNKDRDDAAVLKRNQAVSAERLVPDRAAIDHRAIETRQVDPRVTELEQRDWAALLPIENQRRLVPLQEAEPAPQ